ncbi:oxidoreductase [Aspergillus flavus]|nr:oxidoreductase [Aspergillus flavus]RAQ66122.1 oxidoreductase [Aspergillus flavus]
MTTTALHGWHPGEISMQRKLGYTNAVKDAWPTIRNIMPEQHRVFHTSNLPFIPITTVDEDGRPWAAIVAGPTGEPGFVHSPDSQNLSIHAHLWDGDPLLDTVNAWVDPSSALSTIAQRSLAAGLGIEFSTRRRNKFAGTIQRVECQSSLDYKLHLRVTQTTGNCPKYINVRKLIPHPNTLPKVEHRYRHWEPQGRLPEEVVAFIRQADTVFVGSIYKSSPSDLHKFPPHVGMNARSGLPGFIRVSPSDGRTVVVPDYSGNRFMSTLGNIETSGVVGLTIVSFTTGDILYLTGTAKNLVGPLALEIMTRHAAITTVNVTGFVFVRDALPVRQQDGTPVERSPYSPKIKYLVEETGAKGLDSKEHKAKLREVVQVSSDLAVFKFQVISKPGAGDLRIRPGQAIVLDFMNWIGPPQYQHMKDTAPSSINDDRVRTWTVSSAHEERNATWFELIMREMKGGAVTGALFDRLRKYRSTRLGQRIVFDPPVVADIVGVTGDFFMDNDKLDALWVAGGIGITPFLAMLRALAERGSAAEGDVMLVLATREPSIMLYMMRPSLKRIASTVRINITIFTHDSEFDHGNLKSNQNICVHRDRVVPDFWRDIPRGKDVFICGPSAFGDSVADGLRAVGFSPSQIHREGFY